MNIFSKDLYKYLSVSINLGGILYDRTKRSEC